MISPSLALQKAIYDRLSSVVKVYDSVPEGAKLPYVVIGEDIATDWGTKLKDGQNVSVTLHIWSDYNGMAEAKEMASTVLEALTSEPLEVQGFDFVLCRLELLQFMVDPEGYRHGVVRLSCKILEV